MSAAIVNNRIAGTRITVWDITHYLEDGTWSQQEIADVLRLSLEQVEAAVKYIDEHKEEVWAVHREIEERHARGNPPELQAKLDASHKEFLEFAERFRAAKRQEGIGARHPR